jgi:hypothetical protein
MLGVFLRFWAWTTSLNFWAWITSVRLRRVSVCAWRTTPSTRLSRLVVEVIFHIKSKEHQEIGHDKKVRGQVFQKVCVDQRIAILDINHGVKPGQDKTRQNRTGRDKTRPNKTRQDKTFCKAKKSVISKRHGK